MFWDNSLSYFGAALPGGAAQRGAACIFWNLQPLTGRNQLTALVSGASAYSGETAAEEELNAMAMKVLRTLFKESVPDPIGVAVTRWLSEDYSKGSKKLSAPNFKA